VSQTRIEPGDPYVGATLAGKYHLTELIGVGAMGRVYLFLGDNDDAIRMLQLSAEAHRMTTLPTRRSQRPTLFRADPRIAKRRWLIVSGCSPI